MPFKLIHSKVIQLNNDNLKQSNPNNNNIESSPINNIEHNATKFQKFNSNDALFNLNLSTIKNNDELDFIEKLSEPENQTIIASIDEREFKLDFDLSIILNLSNSSSQIIMFEMLIK